MVGINRCCIIRSLNPRLRCLVLSLVSTFAARSDLVEGRSAEICPLGAGSRSVCCLLLRYKALT